MYIQTYGRDEPDACATRRTHTCMHACMHAFYFISTHLPHTCVCNCVHMQVPIRVHAFARQVKPGSSKVQLVHTYLSETMRIARNENGQVQPPPAPPARTQSLCIPSP